MKTGTRILIVGGGFAGVTVAQHLERTVAANVEVVVISETNHLVFTPMLPEVVGRTISPLHVVVAGRELTRKVRWLEARITHLDRDLQTAHYALANGEEGALTYTQLVLACGSRVNIGEIPGLADRGYALKTVMDAIVLGNDLIGNFEAATAENDPVARRRLLSVVVIGGGFSGVEVAGHIADLMRSIHRFYPELEKVPRKIHLLQKNDRILPELNHEALSAFALKKLRQNKIDVRLGVGAKEVTPTAVGLSSGESIEAGIVVCTIGTDTQPMIRSRRRADIRRSYGKSPAP